MDSRKRRMVRLTSIFIALETAFMYYVIGLFYLSRIPGTPFQYFPGLGYIIKTFFPVYWDVNYQNSPGEHIITHQQVGAALVQFHNGEHFILGFWYGLIIAATITAAVYIFELKNFDKTKPKALTQAV